jgi:hypothetical protein
MRGRPILFIFILLLAAIGLGLFVYSRWSGSTSGDSSKHSGAARAKDDPNRIKSGPNYKPIEPILGTSPEPKKNSDTKQEEKPLPELDYGRTTPVRGDLSPQTKSIVEAVQTKSHPERLSPLIPPKPFDPVAYKQNSKAYLDVVEPGRAFQSAQPGKDVPRLLAISPQMQTITQGKSAKLKVKAVPGYPVTFTSFDLGRFHNQLTTVTVEANDSGVAEADFTGASGTINEVDILASCPVASGQARFLVYIQRP